MTPTAPSQTNIGEPPTKAEDTSPPRSLPPVVPSLPPPRHSAVPGATADLSAVHRWLADPRLTQLRRSVSDEHLIAVYRWGIDPTWTTNQIVGHVHAALEKKADRKVFEDELSRCVDKAALMELVYRTLAAQPPEVAERRARMLGLAR
ncbi:MAG: hypothetical protein ACLP1X_11740 [Polyangiaceae bacterium]